MRTLLVIALSLCASVASAQNPCTQPLPPGVILSANSEVVAALTTHNTVVNGIPIVTDYQLGVFLPGVDPAKGGMPVSTITITKAEWILKTGTPDCYGSKPKEILAIPINADRFGALKSRRTTPDVVESAWSI
jgi:hypothetical protein